MAIQNDTTTIDKLYRYKDVEFALGNAKLEGYSIPPALQDLLERHARSEITMEQLFIERDQLLAAFRAKN